MPASGPATVVAPASTELPILAPPAKLFLPPEKVETPAAEKPESENRAKGAARKTAHGTPPAPPVLVRKDGSPPDLRPDLSGPLPLAPPESAAKPSTPAKDEVKPSGKRKKKSQLRMEDL
jgi:hypothetical protein